MTRKEAIKRMEICRNFLANNYSDMGEPNFTAFNMAIKALEQEPKTGKWRQIGYDIYECSICGQNVMTGDICAYKHCHGCGAKMESEDK